MPVKSITSLSELESLISSGVAVAIDFYAVWCGPCRAVSPHFETLSNKFSNITFVKIDVDQAGEIAQKMEITAMPTFMFFKGGKKVNQVVGADVAAIERSLNSLN